MSNVVNAITKGPAKIWDTLGVSSGNALRRATDPASVVGENMKNGAPVTASNLIDPGRGLMKSPLDPKAANDANDAAIAAMPSAPNQDTAANSAQQQADYLRRRRGVLGNIFGGNQPNSTPVVSQKTLLGQ